MGASQKIGELRVSAQDQLNFARLAGDYNPIHVDESTGRQSIFGNVVVHGINAVLSSIEMYLAASMGEASAELPSLERIQVQFLKPIFVGERLEVIRISDDRRRTRLSVRCEQADLAKISLTWNQAAGRKSPALRLQDRVAPPRRDPVTRTMQDAEGLTGKLPLRADAGLLNAAYPRCVDWLGERALAGVALLSSVVGMEWPGEYSLFTNAKIDFRDLPGNAAADDLTFRVVPVDADYALTRLAVQGPDFRCEIDAFFRPVPVKQPSIGELRSLVLADEFKGCTAVVIGGSRGLGEISAKLLALGGAEIILSYRSSATGAANVRDDIVSAGARCNLVRFDVGGDVAALAAFEASPARLLLLYFPSPHIFRRRTAGFSKAWLTEFLGVYVDGFVDVLNAAKRWTAGPFAVLYPSSEALDSPSGELIEYAAAKAAGEAVCRAAAADDPRLMVEIPRLPRLLTDQTNSIVQVETLQAPDILLPILRRMAANTLRQDESR